VTKSLGRRDTMNLGKGERQGKSVSQADKDGENPLNSSLRQAGAGVGLVGGRGLLQGSFGKMPRRGQELLLVKRRTSKGI